MEHLLPLVEAHAERAALLVCDRDPYVAVHHAHA